MVDGTTFNSNELPERDIPAAHRLQPGGRLLEFEFTLRFALEDDKVVLPAVMERLDAVDGLHGVSFTGLLEVQS